VLIGTGEATHDEDADVRHAAIAGLRDLLCHRQRHDDDAAAAADTRGGALDADLSRRLVSAVVGDGPRFVDDYCQTVELLVEFRGDSLSLGSGDTHRLVLPVVDVFNSQRY